MNTLLWWLVQNSLTVAAMIPLVMLAGWLFRHRPAVQHALWVVVLLKLVTPAVVVWSWSAAELQEKWSSRQATAIAPFAEEQSLAPRDEAEKRRDFEALLAASMAADTLPQTNEVVTNPSTGDSPMAAAASSPAWYADSQNLQTGGLVLASLWLIGSITWCGRQMLRIARHGKLVRKGKSATSKLTREVSAVASEFGLRMPRTVVAGGILTPFIWCFGRLRLVWPEVLSAAGDIARSRSVIAHELAHVKRRDHYVAWLALAAGAIWWWNPLYWFVVRRVRHSAELACDALALGTCQENRRAYAELLLELSASFKSGAPAPVLGVSTGAPSTLERRLSMILSDRVSGKTSAAGLLVTACLALVAIPGWSLGQQGADEKPAPAPADTNRGGEAKFDVAVGQILLQIAQKDEGKEPSAIDFQAMVRSFLPKPCLEGQPAKGVIDAQSCQKCHDNKPKKVEDKAKSEPLPAEWQAILRTLLPKPCLEGVPAKAAIGLQSCQKCHENSQPQQVGDQPKPATAAEALLQSIGQPHKAEAPATETKPNAKAELHKWLIAGQDKQKPQVVYLKGNDLMYEVELVVGKVTVTARNEAKETVWKSEFTDPSLKAPAGKIQWNIKEAEDKKGVGIVWRQALEGRESKAQAAWFDAKTGKLWGQALEGATAEDKSYNKTPAETADARIKALEQSISDLKSQLNQQRERAFDVSGRPAAAGSGDAAATNPPRAAREPVATDVTDLGVRYIDALAARKLARSRAERIKSVPENVISQSEREEAAIALENAEQKEQLLLTLIENAKAAAEVVLSAAQNDLQRIQKLYEAKAVSTAELDKARLEVQSAAARVKQFEAILKWKGGVGKPGLGESTDDKSSNSLPAILQQTKGQLTDAEVQREHARAELTRMERLVERGFATASDLTKAQAQLALMDAELQRLKAILSKAEVSPDDSNRHE